MGIFAPAPFRLFLVKTYLKNTQMLVLVLLLHVMFSASQYVSPHSFMAQGCQVNETWIIRSFVTCFAFCCQSGRGALSLPFFQPPVSMVLFIENKGSLAR